MQQSLLADVLDTAPILVFVADDRMTYVAVNETACEALGYSREEFLRLRVTDVAIAREAPELYEEMMRTRSQEGSTMLRTKDGREVRFFYNARQTSVAGLTYFVSAGFLEDMLPEALRAE